MHKRKMLALIYTLACIFFAANGQEQPPPSDKDNSTLSSQPTEPPPLSEQPSLEQPNDNTPVPSSSNGTTTNTETNDLPPSYQPTQPPPQLPPAQSPSPSLPAPTIPNNTPLPSPNNNKTNSSNSNSSLDSGSSSANNAIINPPTSSDQPSNQQSSSKADTENEGLSSSVIIGIVIAVIGLVAIVGVFLYRGVMARKKAFKDYDLDFPGSTVLEPADSPFYLTKRADAETASSHTPKPLSPASQASPVEKGHPNLSPPACDNEEVDYNSGRSFTASFAKSSGKSFSGSYSEYSPSFIGSTLNTPSIVDDDHSPAASSRDGEGSHWLDAMEENVRDTEGEMRNTSDSYAMLQSESFESAPRDSYFSLMRDSSTRESMRESSMGESSMSRLSGYSDMSYRV